MKKSIYISCAAAALLALTGCSDAKAELSKSDQVVVKVGNKEITKEDLYTTMKMSNGFNTVVEQITLKIVNKEVPATPEMEEAARTSFNTYKESVKDSFEEYLKNSGYESEEEYYKAVFLVDQQRIALTRKYVEKNYTSLMNEYRPMKAQILEFDEEEIAKTTFAEIQAGKGFEEFAKTGNTTNFEGSEKVVNAKSTGMSSVAFTQMKGVKKNGTLIDNVIHDSTSNKYYIVKVNDTDPNNFKEEAINSILELEEVSDKAFTFYLNKYKFTIYDIDIYNAIKENKPGYIVQD